MERAILLMTNSVRSPATAKSYFRYMTHFKDFCNYSDFDVMADKGRQDPKAFQIQVEDFVMDLKARLNPNSVPTCVYPIFSFCEANDIFLNSKKIKKMFPAFVKKSGREAYTTEQIASMARVATEYKNIALVYFLASTGVRIGALPSLTIGDLHEIKNCYAVTVYADTIEEYVTFLNPEAKQALDSYFAYRQAKGEIFSKNTPVFRAKFRVKSQKVEKTTESALSTLILKLTRKAGLRNPMFKKDGRFLIQQAHGFRKRFITILKSNPSIPIAYAERMAGHKMYSDDSGNRITLDESYLRPKLEKLFSFYEMAIPELTIDQTNRLQLENELQQQKIIENETLRKRVSELEAKYSQLELEKKQQEQAQVQTEVARLELEKQSANDREAKESKLHKDKQLQRLDELVREIEQIKHNLQGG